MPKEKQTRKKKTTEKLGSIKYTFYLVTMYKYIYPHLEKHTDWTARASSCFSGYRAVMRNSLVRRHRALPQRQRRLWRLFIHSKNTALLQPYSPEAFTLRQLLKRDYEKHRRAP